MSALRFDVDLEWRADQIVGEITVGGVRTTVSEPRLMGGTGVGMSPEDLDQADGSRRPAVARQAQALHAEVA